MYLVEWDNSMSTGVADIDKQHQELLSKLNELSAALEEHRAEAIITKIVDYLQIYAAWHFKREEECMAYYDCPMADANQRAHVQFLKKFGRFYDLVHQGGPLDELALAVHRELVNWLVNHICRVDAGLRECVPDN